MRRAVGSKCATSKQIRLQMLPELHKEMNPSQSLSSIHTHTQTNVYIFVVLVAIAVAVAVTATAVDGCHMWRSLIYL